MLIFQTILSNYGNTIFSYNIRCVRVFLMLKHTVSIVEVGPRDGLQNESVVLPLEVKVDLLNRLSQTGLKRIETGSFVNPKLIPQFCDSEQLFVNINRVKNVKYSALVPNVKGLQKAIIAKADEIALFASATETFSKKNINCSIEESFIRFKDVMDIAKEHKLPTRGYLSCVIKCPFEGDTDPSVVAKLVKRMIDLGCCEISLGDTIGVGTPETITKMLEACLKLCNVSQLAIHCHDTNGKALANIDRAIDMGIRIVDSSIAGLGGCPFAGPNASGNVATERLVDLLHKRGMLDEDIDREAIHEVAVWISDILRKAKSR